MASPASGSAPRAAKPALKLVDDFDLAEEGVGQSRVLDLYALDTQDMGEGSMGNILGLDAETLKLVALAKSA